MIAFSSAIQSLCKQPVLIEHDTNAHFYLSVHANVSQYEFRVMFEHKTKSLYSAIILSLPFSSVYVLKLFVHKDGNLHRIAEQEIAGFKNACVMQIAMVDGAHCLCAVCILGSMFNRQPPARIKTAKRSTREKGFLSSPHFFFLFLPAFGALLILAQMYYTLK